ncbi:MAG TPA: DedA family protein [Ktedonobacteraceae bacterium]|nr:DedA family protein [Ktedonobacteraceae bacterium]
MIGVWLPFLHVVFHLPLAALISLDTLRNALNVLGYPAVALFIMIESMGIPFPGETMLLLASFYAALDHRLQIPLVIVCAAFGAIIGDNIGYLIGRTGGYPLVRRFGRYVFLKPEHLERAERFFDKHGNKTVFFGRFVAVLRAWAAFLAGVNRMRWSTFLIYNAAGGILWAIIYGCLGFYAGRLFHSNFGAVERLASTISWAGAALIVVAVVAAYIFFRWRRAHHAQPESSQGQPTTGELQSEVDSYAQQATPDQEKPKDEEGLHPERISSSDPQ